MEISTHKLRKIKKKKHMKDKIKEMSITKLRSDWPNSFMKLKMQQQQQTLLNCSSFHCDNCPIIKLIILVGASLV